ncbi:hypothetical protein R1flu_024589 [Riccia fluitans]|uniref:Uncharacterized protein n=1 Tax=Riccia fluitans TaxID=41844 RepID=A0ABD1XVG9_9MARC
MNSQPLPPLANASPVEAKWRLGHRHEFCSSPPLANALPVEAKTLPSLLLFPYLAAANMDLNRLFWRKVWHSGKLNIEFHCNHPELKKNRKKWMREANPTLNGKSTQVRKSLVFFAGLELYGIKIDCSKLNVHKGINRHSAKEKQKARKELWRMQVKFEGEGRTYMPSGDASADPSPVVDKGKAKVEEGPNISDDKNLEKLDAAQMKRARRENTEANRPTDRILAENKPGQVSQKGNDPCHGKGGMDSPCPPRPTMQVEEDVGHVHGFVDQMLHDFKIANQEHDGLQRRPDLYELLTEKLRGHHIRGHPYAIASFPNVTLTCTRKITTFPEDIDQFKMNMDAYPELKHAVEHHKGMIKYKTDCSVYGIEVINRNTGELDTGEAGLHPDEFQGGNNEVDIAACDENKVLLVTEVSRALDTPGLDVDRFLGRVPRATLGNEHTPSREGGSDYIDELGPLTVARLRREFALLESQVRGNRPLTWAQARVLFPQPQHVEHSPPQEVTLAEIPMDHVEDIQSPPSDVASEPIEAT